MAVAGSRCSVRPGSSCASGGASSAGAAGVAAGVDLLDVPAGRVFGRRRAALRSGRSGGGRGVSPARAVAGRRGGRQTASGTCCARRSRSTSTIFFAAALVAHALYAVEAPPSAPPSPVARWARPRSASRSAARPGRRARGRAREAGGARMSSASPPGALRLVQALFPVRALGLLVPALVVAAIFRAVRGMAREPLDSPGAGRARAPRGRRPRAAVRSLCRVAMDGSVLARRAVSPRRRARLGRASRRARRETAARPGAERRPRPDPRPGARDPRGADAVADRSWPRGLALGRGGRECGQRRPSRVPLGFFRRVERSGPSCAIPGTRNTSSRRSPITRHEVVPWSFPCAREPDGDAEGERRIARALTADGFALIERSSRFPSWTSWFTTRLAPMGYTTREVWTSPALRASVYVRTP